MKKRLVSIMLALALICSCVAIGTMGVSAENETQGFLDRFRNDATLVFDDEFDGDKIDETKWEIASGWGRIDGTYGTVDDGNYAVEDGNLKLRAFEKVTSDNTNGKARNKEIQTGEVSSKAAWGDGLIEVRAKLPKGKGVYPAIWTMGRDFDKNSCNWPWSGEIDIMEACGTSDDDSGNNSTWQTLHTARPFVTSSSNAAHVATSVGKYATADGSALNDDYHSFWVYFDNKVMIIGVDETMMKIMDLSDPNLVCFKEWEQWLILGLQMGGGAGTPVRTTYSVWEMLIDYVRVYRFADKSKYDDYRVFEAESFNTDSNLSAATTLCSRECVSVTGTNSLNSVITGLEPGTYDIYGAITTTTTESTYQPYIQGTQVEGVTISTYEEKPDGDTPYLGTVELEDNSSFELVLKNTKAGNANTTNLEIDKYFFVKTTREPTVVINESNCHKASDKIEVSTADELSAALSKVDYDGTVILKNDITLTKNLIITKNLTLDLGGYTINTGTLAKPFSINTQSVTVKFTNGKFVVGGNNGVIASFVALDQKTTAVEFDGIDLEFSAYKYSKSGYVLIGSQYSSGGKTVTVKNSTVNFTGVNTDLGSNQYYFNGIFGATTLNMYNSTFKGSSILNLIFSENPNSGYSKGIAIKNCNIDNFCMVFNGKTDINSSKNPISIANTNITNCVSLANSDANALKFLPATNNTITTAEGTEIEAADITNDIGTIKYVCSHEYNDATCTSPEACKYCGKTTGASEASHTPGKPEIIQAADCCRPEKTKITCTVCGEVLSEKITAPATGHNFAVETIEPQICTAVSYLRKTCQDCGYVVTTSTNNGMTTYGGTAHVIDESTVVRFDDCKSGKGYYYTCSVCGKENIKKIENIGRHELEVTAFTPATESAQGSITYECKTCDYVKTKTYDYGTKLVTLDGIPYIATAGCYATPYITPDDFMYYLDSDGNKYARDEVIEVSKDMTLTTVTDSEHVHTPDSAQDKVVPPTCSDDGYTEHVCSVCNQKYKTDIISATGIHTYVENTDSKYLKSAANCHSKAVYYKSCSACDHMSEETFEVGELNPNNHEGETEVRNAKAATCKEDGYTGDTYCKACDTKISSGTVITKGAHDKSGEWQTDGTNHWKVCSVCGEEIEKAAHSGGTATCKHKAVCSVCGAEHGELSPNNHEGETEVRNAKAATCKEDGYTGDTYCLGCKAKISSGTTINKSAHTSSDKWTTDGTNHWKVCTVCGETVEKAAHSGGTATCTHKAVCSVCSVEHGELNPNNHEGETEVRNAKIATCKDDGYTGDTYCKACDTKISDGTAISAKGHTEETIKGKAATCCDSGLTEGKKCSVCGEILVKQTEIPATGHTLKSIAAKPATHATEGNMAYFECTVCGKYFSDENGKNEITLADTILQKIPHDFGEYKYDETKHWHECACGVIADEGEHTYGDWVVVSGVKFGRRERVCSVCGYVDKEEIVTVNYGDLNGDSKINLLDLIALRKHLAKWTIEIDKAAADCNADGKINLMDLILLRKYLAKWNVILGPQK